MLTTILRWFGFDPAMRARAEARRLDRDAARVIESATAAAGPGGSDDIAAALGPFIEEVDGVAAANGSLTRLRARFEDEHRGAKRNRDMNALTVLTLALIYLRARALEGETDERAAAERVSRFAGGLA